MGSLERRWHYELGQRDARIAELEAKVEMLREAQDSACKAKDDIVERLCAALSQRDRLAEALRSCEWRGRRHFPPGFLTVGRDYQACPECGGIAPHDGHRDWRPQDYGHRESCSVGCALVALEEKR